VSGAATVALLLSLTAWDWLGGVSRAELYSALIVDAETSDQGRRILVAAYNDPRVTFGQWTDLKVDYMRNHGTPIFLAFSDAFAPVCEAPRE
jgi:hypothetical protein